MKRIIDIPDNEYRHIKEYYEKNDIVEATYSYIYYGIPLPKGHGDLIDRDDLLADSYCIDDWSGNEVNIVDVMTVKMADAIIEADKAESENKGWQK